MIYMGEDRMDSSLKERLKSLCRSNGWCYGVFWRFDRRNPMLLTMEDAYWEEEIEGMANNMLLKVHMLGDGIVGQIASSGKHQWIFSDDNGGGGWNSACCVGSQDVFKEDSEICRQFSSGIKTIAVISISRGVIQFGSITKIVETQEFLDQIRRFFGDNGNVNSFTSAANPSSSLDYESYDLDEWFASFCNVNITPMHGDVCNELPDISCSSLDLMHLTSDVQQDMAELLCFDTFHAPNQFQVAGAEAESISSTDFSAQFQQVALECASAAGKFAPKTECIGSLSKECSIVTSLEAQLPSEKEVLDCSSTHATGVKPLETESIQKSSYEFKPDVTTNFSTLDNLLEGFSSSAVPTIGGQSSIKDEKLSELIGVYRVPSGLIGDIVLEIPFKQPTDSVPSSINYTSVFDGQKNPASDKDAEKDFFQGLGLEFGSGKAGDCLEDMMKPVLSGGHSATSTGVSECISELDVCSTAGPRRGLFSELGIEELFDGVNRGNKSGLHGHPSATKRMRTESSLHDSNQVQLSSVSCSSSSFMMQAAYNIEKKDNLQSRKDIFSKSQVGLWIDDSYGVANGIIDQAPLKKPEEPKKASKKRARPGESTRPRPKDRQMIQDRLKELKGIIPGCQKETIDNLLDRTIKHILFFQSLAKYADKLKQAEQPKLIGPESRLLLKDSSGNTSGATWALEVGKETMVCPIRVEDLGPPGLMLIEMVCGDRGFFLEIADVIRGFGLNILKGLMETREDKIWARFIVEANHQITRIEIFFSLFQLLEQMESSGMNSTTQPTDVMAGRAPLLEQPAIPCPISMAESV